MEFDSVLGVFYHFKLVNWEKYISSKMEWYSRKDGYKDKRSALFLNSIEMKYTTNLRVSITKNMKIV